MQLYYFCKQKKNFIVMMQIRKMWVAYMVMCTCSFWLSSCTDDYNDSELRNDIENLEDRVTTLEKWQKSVNGNIQSLQNLIAALEDKDYVTGVTPLEDGTGYVITFLKSGNITIKHGEKGEQGNKGDTPVVSVKQDADGKYYWTINGEWLLDNGNKIPVTGEKGDKGDTGSAGKTAIAPQMRINAESNEWEISTDNGTTWTSTGIKATGEKGDSMFSAIDTNNGDYVELTLANGTTKIKLPRYTSAIRFESHEIADVYVVGETELNVILPNNLTSSNYNNLMATVTPTSGTYTRAGSNGWSVSVDSPDFSNALITTTVTVKGNSSLTIGDQALLSVILTYTDGTQVTASRLVKITPLGTKMATDNNIVKGDYYMSDGSFVNKSETLTELQKTACVGIVFALANEVDQSDYSNTGIGQQKCHGYVVALADATATVCMWGVKGTALNLFPENVSNNLTSPEMDWNGYDYTQTIIAQVRGTSKLKPDKAEGYPATYYAVVDYEKKVKAPKNSSGWFLPSIGQMYEVYQQRDLLAADPLGRALRSNCYWSSSEVSFSSVNDAPFVYVETGRVASNTKNADGYVRSILAF